MAAAEVGDDVFGEDPTVRELEERVARLLGHEGGLFTPTGSMANQLALRLHVRPGEELVSDELAHVVRAELGAAAVFSGITSRTWSAPRGLLDPRQPMELAVTGAGPYQVCTALVVVENTHNFGGGTVQPIEAIRAVRAGTREPGHPDAPGRRAAVERACGERGAACRLRAGVRHCVGVPEQRAWRTGRLGSRRPGRRHGRGPGVAQAVRRGHAPGGILAAAGRYALDRHVERLADDHARARRAATAFAEAAPGSVDPATVETNIVMLDATAAGWAPADLSTEALAAGVRGYAAGPAHVRFSGTLTSTTRQRHTRSRWSPTCCGAAGARLAGVRPRGGGPREAVCRAVAAPARPGTWPRAPVPLRPASASSGSRRRSRPRRRPRTPARGS